MHNDGMTAVTESAITVRIMPVKKQGSKTDQDRVNFDALLSFFNLLTMKPTMMA
jgi:hypothetical protein